ncbi:cyclic 2,3-diphosphoglycerate synthase [Desulforhopalus singaporensis]|uniref:Predicted GTPase n=1 Tax=Desulforhopalus singaporensis TaxID=91360 RepID=A0A1H0TDY1_9BACT|nr:cyclic 2,3-diphosphoglycerate synthase [Desulforhopalus singaporensis]SDP51798.1 Predicted GTPase [Desulforhopalus singaporensis]
MIKQTIIMGAAGRDFHNFNVYFRDNPDYRVVAFTATQIPGIEGRCYPPGLAGKLYPEGIPIIAETELVSVIRGHKVELAVLSYSDISYPELMHKASVVTAEQADFMLLSARRTMLKSTIPVISVCAVRTGCGKSPTTRKIYDILTSMGKKPVVVRHPMAYGDLTRQAVQRFSSYDDLNRHRCTIEEREEYELLIDHDITVFAGVDYQKILEEAEKEADIIIWDGGNNDTPFFAPDIHIVLFDPHRAGHERFYYPGEVNMIMADIAIIAKVGTADQGQIELVRQNIARHNPGATIILADTEVTITRGDRIKNRKVLVVEDGPTLTHGGMSHGAGMVAARLYKAAEVVNPRPYAVGTIEDTYRNYPHIGPVLPAMGYSSSQIQDLERTINNTVCDLVLFATPIRLDRLLSITRPAVRVYYNYADRSDGELETMLRPLVDRLAVSSLPRPLQP